MFITNYTRSYQPRLHPINNTAKADDDFSNNQEIANALVNILLAKTPGDLKEIDVAVSAARAAGI